MGRNREARWKPMVRSCLDMPPAHVFVEPQLARNTPEGHGSCAYASLACGTGDGAGPVDHPRRPSRTDEREAPLAAWGGAGGFRESAYLKPSGYRAILAYYYEVPVKMNTSGRYNECYGPHGLPPRGRSKVSMPSFTDASNEIHDPDQ